MKYIEKMGYNCIQIIKECYDFLYDEQSKKLFFARLSVDVDPSDQQIQQLISLSNCSKSYMLEPFPWIRTLAEQGTPVYLYGAGDNGKFWCTLLLEQGINVKGFLDQRYETLPPYLGLPVLPPPPVSPDWAAAMDPDAKILISTSHYEYEVRNILIKAGFPEEKLLPRVGYAAEDLEHQYFDFMEHIPAGGIFVDGGCFDLDTSIRFAQWSSNKDFEIVAFEPDPINYKICMKKLAENHLEHIQVIPSGLWEKEDTLHFASGNGQGSSIAANGDICVSVVALDEVMQEERVSFLKLDIEGAELGALKGASNILQRDKPLCAICVYHKPGDMLAIMSYLKHLVPEYKFAIRHYAASKNGTVLYAFLERQPSNQLTAY